MAHEVEQVYVDLLDRINSLGFGFDHGPEGCEYGLIERFFTPEEAQWVLEMPLNCFFTAKEWAEQTGKTLQECIRILESASVQGQIYR